MLKFKLHEYISAYALCFFTSLVYYIYKADCNWKIELPLIELLTNTEDLFTLLVQSFALEMLLLAFWIFMVGLMYLVFLLVALILDTH